ncbi:glycine oxidase ThiO [Bacillus sp. V3B]|uniref:glycine oxidase ThiO n=1 Tax=Bacillus sp. V3B TaxID=2804915 RepID=UPI00210B49E3|nr:glycine oxidase ThiO [Bacillus sp. V3B]MCQ6275034.1 glycine oxidase ThiO [Bacillus sp. V3B]
MKTNYEVVVIGGGIIGCSIAYYLAKENVDVALFEGRQIGSKSTGAAAGMLGAHSECDGDFDVFFPFARSSQRAYAQLKEELRELSGIDMEYRKGGILKLAFTETDKKNLNSMISQPTVKWLEAEVVRNSESTITPNLLGAAFIEDDVNVVPTRVCQSFAKSAGVLGASIFEYTHVIDIQKKEKSFLIQTTTGQFEAKHVVVANGVWSTSFFEQSGLNHQLVPVKGECLSVYDEKATLKHTLFHEQCYIVPRNNGKLVIGATMIENDWNERVSLGGVESLIAKAKTMLPAISDMKLDSFWAGLRPQTFDQKPFIGHHPEEEGILFATGHYRNGILLAPATGQMITDLILKREIKKEWVEAFKIDRRQPSYV